MLREKLRIPWNSMRVKLFIISICVLLPLVALLLYYNIYAIGVVHNQVAVSYRHMITMYMDQLDNNLENVDEYLANLIALNTDLHILEYSATDADTDTDIALASVRLKNQLSKDISIFKSIDAIFIYSVPRQYFIEIDSLTSSSDDQMSVSSHLKAKFKNSIDSDSFQPMTWNVELIGQDYYIFQVVRMGDTFVGAWVSASKLMSPFSRFDNEENNISLLIDSQGVPMINAELIGATGIDLNQDFSQYHLLGDGQKYLVVGEKSSKGNFSLLALIPDNMILEKLPYLQLASILISIGLAALVPLCLILLSKIVLTPLKRMLVSMRKIREGNWETRIDPYPTSDEFRIVNETFNKMVDEIHDLKISIYEEKIHQQREELQHLQLQLNPHFFMNSLNIIYRLAQTGQYSLIQEMSLCLLDYFRYVLRDNQSLIPLKDELQHVQNYIRIQELRFSRKLTYEIKYPEFLSATPVPLLIIQCFVENTVKYTLPMENSVFLSIVIDFVEVAMKPFMSIQIKDSGNGFPEQVRSELQNGQKIIDDRGEHIGIWNLNRRLRLIYGGEASISFSNGSPSGAVVDILLPISKDQKLEVTA